MWGFYLKNIEKVSWGLRMEFDFRKCNLFYFNIFLCINYKCFIYDLKEWIRVIYVLYYRMVNLWELDGGSWFFVEICWLVL